MSITRKLVYTAVFVALSCVANYFEIETPVVKMSFTYTVCFLAGIYLGIIPAMVVGCLGDLIIALIKYGEPNLLILLSSTLIGAMPALVFKVLPKLPRLVKLAIGGALSLLVCTFGIGSIAIWLMRFVSDGMVSMPFFTFLFTLRLPQLIPFAVNMITLALLITHPAVNKIFATYKIEQEQKEMTA